MKVAIKYYYMSFLIFAFFFLGLLNYMQSYTVYIKYIGQSSVTLSGIQLFLFLNIALCFILITLGLVKRVFSAWLAAVSLSSIIICINILQGGLFQVHTLIMLLALASFLFLRKAFIFQSSTARLKKMVILLLAVIICDTLSFWHLWNTGRFSLSARIAETFVGLFSGLPLSSLGMVDFALLEILVLAAIAAVFVFLILLSRNTHASAQHSEEEKERARNLLLAHAKNSVSYILMEDDKRYFFSEKTEGVIGYTIVSGAAVVAGDPVCAEADIPMFLIEFTSFCKRHSLSICFCQIGSDHLKAYTQAGFNTQEYGKEAVLDLKSYSITGSKTAKVRWANNKMDKLGISISEYSPRIRRNDSLEQEIHLVSEDWLKTKKSGALSFMLGSISLDKPFDRRYFVAIDSSGQLQGFIICLPYHSGKGYFVDVTRRRKDAPLGITEKLIIGTAELLKREGVEELSLGLAPLADIEHENQLHSKLLYCFFKLIYHRMNAFYDFQSLYEYKKKYNPSVWKPSYIAYYPVLCLPQIVYAMIRSKNPRGLLDFVTHRVVSHFRKSHRMKR